ncbi:MAG: hypothetical protein J3K34DRAFT_526683 [Monoraphidium minutum]|nr:MAG: hypothetical protein J3K34DRAFT_526683 [Monoraphidium minutum]
MMRGLLTAPRARGALARAHAGAAHAPAWGLLPRRGLSAEGGGAAAAGGDPLGTGARGKEAGRVMPLRGDGPQGDTYSATPSYPPESQGGEGGRGGGAEETEGAAAAGPGAARAGPATKAARYAHEPPPPARDDADATAAAGAAASEGAEGAAEAVRGAPRGAPYAGAAPPPPDMPSMDPGNPASPDRTPGGERLVAPSALPDVGPPGGGESGGAGRDPAAQSGG